MTTLIVQLPPRDPAVPAQEWRLPEMPFMLFDKRGRLLRAVRSSLALLPRASVTVLMLAARDVLLVQAIVPPLKGQRLLQALPNIIEDCLIQDPQTCHIAVDPVSGAAPGARTLAALDRGWFRFLHEAFTEAGHRGLRAVPLTRCLPGVSETPEAPIMPDFSKTSGDLADAAPPMRVEAVPLGVTGMVSEARPCVAALLGEVVSTDPACFAEAGAPLVTGGAARIELVFVCGARGEGLAVPAAAVGETLAALAGAAPVTVYRLTDVPGAEPALVAPPDPLLSYSVQPLPFETLARNALACRFDLCQFEFTARPFRLGRQSARQLRLPVILALVSVLVAVIGANMQWLLLARQRDGINAEMTELLLTTFPKTTAVLDAPAQMSRELDRLRVAAGELAPTDFLTLADGLARSLGPLPSTEIRSLDYTARELDVTFGLDVKVDDAFAQRLARNGLSGRPDNSTTGKWMIRSVP